TARLRVFSGERKPGGRVIEARAIEAVGVVAFDARPEISVRLVALFLMARLAFARHAAKFRLGLGGPVTALARDSEVLAGELELRSLVVIEEVLFPRDGAVAEAALSERFVLALFLVTAAAQARRAHEVELAMATEAAHGL